MVFDDETEFDMNENTTSNESKKKEPQLERYGVWIKKGPENLESPQEIPQTMDDSVIDNDLIAPEQEQIESIDEELDSLIGSDTIIEESTLEKDEISNTETILEPEIPSETGLPEGFDIPGIDLSAFENNDIIAPSGDSSGEVSIDMDDFFSSDSGDGEVDLSSLFGDGESIDFDDFMGGGGKKKEPEIIDEPPLNIELEFDDNFVLETKADPVSQVEFIGLDGESGEMSFDDLFDSIQDEGAAFPSDFGDSDTPKIPEVDISAFAGEDITSAFMSDTPTTVVEETKSSTETAYDDASEFDDLLSSLDDATPLTETPEEAKSKKLIQDYDITVTMDEEDLSEDEEEEEGETSNDDLDDISLFQSNEDIERFKQQAKNNGAPVGGMKVLEAQSSMDFDEIDKILEDGGFEFPSDEVKDVTQEETDDISLEETQLDDTSIEIQDFEVPSNQIEPNEDIPTEENDFVADEIDSSLETEIQEIDIEDSAPLLVEDSEQESTDESDFSISKPELNDDILIDEETDELSDDITLEDDFDIEPTTSFEDSIDIEDSLIEEENTDETLILETDIEEDEIEANEKLDETFLEIEDDQVENTDDEIQSTQEDELLDMDFSEDAMEIQEENNTIELEDEISIDDTENTDESEIEESDINLISEEETQEEEILADTINETIQEEQGEITMEENGIINDEQNLSQNVESSNLLEKIAAEISNLRSEITNLRTEFNSFKVTPTQETSEEDISSDDNETSGFFSDDNEDETIALSGDELNNILNNADFTTEEAEEELVENISDETVTETEEDAVINPLGDATELTDSDIDTMDEYEDSSFADDSEVSNFANEDLQEPELEDLQMDNNFEEEEDLSEEIDVPKDEEVYEEPETNDFIESINAEDPSISDTLTEDRLKYLEDSFEDSVDENEEKLDVEILDENENVIEDSTDEIENDLSTEEAEVSDIIENEEDESDESNEPTEDVFNSSQWDNDVTEPTEDNNAETESIVEDEIPEEIIEETENDIVEPVFENEQTEETVDTPVESAEPITKPASSSPTAKIQDDIKSVLVYMDQLLENLPEDKIEEFAKSEHFDTYKKLFNDLGISN